MDNIGIDEDYRPPFIVPSSVTCLLQDMPHTLRFTDAFHQEGHNSRSSKVNIVTN